ncbi:MAG: FeoA family protein [candidate division WOR-3 bacterium]
MKKIELTKMDSGSEGTVVEIYGGQGLKKKLEVLGIRPGVKITKVSSLIMRGPVIIKVGNTRVALGFGMASRILVESEEN